MKTIVITGASRGLGLEFTRQFLERGESVFATCRHPQSASDLQALQADHPNLLKILPLDVMDLDSIQGAVDQVAALKPGVDLLINNAGIGDYSTFDSVIPEELRQLFEVNTIAPLMVMRAFRSLLKTSGSGVIANVSSLLGSIDHKTELVKGGYAYSISKAALNMITRYASIDLKPDDIALASLSPGWVQTDLGGDQAPLRPQESIAGLIRVLDRITLENTGKFWHYDGRELPW